MEAKTVSTNVLTMTKSNLLCMQYCFIHFSLYQFRYFFPCLSLRCFSCVGFTFPMLMKIYYATCFVLCEVLMSEDLHGKKR